MKVAEDFKWKSRRLVIGLVSMLVISYFGDKFVFCHHLFNSRLGLYLGLILLISGFFLASIGGHHLKIYGRSSPDMPRGSTDTLVTQGIYRYVRHPMFTAFILILLGIGFLLNSPTFTFVMVPLGTAYIVWFAYHVDEKEALEKFGKDYEKYKKQVPPFIPIPGRKFKG